MTPLERLEQINKELAKFPHGATSKHTDAKIRRLLKEHDKLASKVKDLTINRITS